MPDILLYIGGGKNEELRYAIRTWEENLNFGKLYVVGGPKPHWLNPDIYVENKLKYPKMMQCYDNLRIALNDDRLTEDVLLMMDDIFILRHWGDWTINHNRGDLLEQCEFLERTHKGTYTEMLRATLKELQKKMPSPLSFEEHAPFLCNRQKLWSILSSYPPEAFESILYRSIYGNLYNIPTEYRKDVKLAGATDTIPSTAPIVSTNEISFRGNAGVALREWYPRPSSYELRFSC